MSPLSWSRPAAPTLCWSTGRSPTRWPTIWPRTPGAAKIPDPVQAGFLTDLARHHAPSYRLTYRTVIDPALGVKDDGHRDIDPHYRQLVDEAITTVHTRLDIPAVPLYSDDHTSAVRHALLLARRTVTPRGTAPE